MSYHILVNILFNWLLSALAIMVSAYVLPGVHVQGFMVALILAVILGIINAILRPILLILTLPINVLTLGLFTFVINAFLVMLAARIVTGFSVDSFLWALAFSLVLSLVNGFFHKLSR